MKKLFLRLSFWGLFFCVPLLAHIPLTTGAGPVASTEVIEQPSPQPAKQPTTEATLPQVTQPILAAPAQPIAYNDLYHYLDIWGNWALASATMGIVKGMTTLSQLGQRSLPKPLLLESVLYGFLVNVFVYLTPLLSQYTKQLPVFHKNPKEVETNGAYHIITLLVHGLCQAFVSSAVANMPWFLDASTQAQEKRISFCMVTASILTLLPILTPLLSTMIRQLVLTPLANMISEWKFVKRWANATDEETKSWAQTLYSSLMADSVMKSRTLNFATNFVLSLVLLGVSMGVCKMCFGGIGLLGCPRVLLWVPLMGFACTFTSQGISLLSEQVKQLPFFQVRPITQVTPPPSDLPVYYVFWIFVRVLAAGVVHWLVSEQCPKIVPALTRDYILQPMVFAVLSYLAPLCSERIQEWENLGRGRNHLAPVPQPVQPSA